MSNQSLIELIEVLGLFEPLLPDLHTSGVMISDAILRGNKIITAGNGGSASDAMHLAEELVGRFNLDRRALPAISLCSDPTILTCIANDYGFEKVFSRQMEAIGKNGDVLIAFSTSGKSKNLIEGIKAAQILGVKTIALLGKDGGMCKTISELSITVPSYNTARIQEVHTFILHEWLNQIESRLNQQ